MVFRANSKVDDMLPLIIAAGVGVVVGIVATTVKEDRANARGQRYRIILTRRIKETDGREIEETMTFEFATEEAMMRAIEEVNKCRSITFEAGGRPRIS